MPATPTGYPAFRPNDGGIYIVCTAANTGYAQAVPAGAKGFQLWFDQAAATPTAVQGRVGLDEAATVQGSITNTSTNLGYVPAAGITVIFDRKAKTATSLYLQVANNTALAVARGVWFF